MKRLVVVESPTKARTIRRYLPAGEYRVEASMGHVRDLPASASEIPAKFKDQKWAKLGVRTDNGFEPLYVIPSDKKKIVKELKAALKEADELYIATDEDREGESIGWHLLQVLNPKVPVRRMVFHEITKDAILAALDNTREINQSLVDAQETRRILDRLVGYTISPLLWKKIAPKLSAGRVQSVAVRLLVLREKDRIAFVPASYWGMKALLEKEGQAFDATMTHYQGLRLAVSRDFNDETGKLKKSLKPGQNIMLLDEAKARSIAGRLLRETWRVKKVDVKRVKRQPYPPFITSTLQQEGSRKLGLSARRTMQVAQRLYEQGFITYMRTDSTNLSQEAIEASRKAVVQRYGEAFLSDGPRTFKGKVRNAQEAHEAIRPAGTEMKTARELGLSSVEAKLYDLIWKRTVATQMADARLRMVSAQIEAGSGDDSGLFRAQGKTIEFPGFFRAYVEGTDDPNAALENREQPLPELSEGDQPTCKEVNPSGHETKPPARYTEATLIKTLEKEGIGRPSTYATIIDTIQHRGYVQRQGNTLLPTFTAFATNTLLELQFDQLVDVGFTAGMEQILDDIAGGGRPAASFLKTFFSGQDGLEKRVEAALDGVDARQVSTLSFPKWGDCLVRVGKYGPYVEGELDSKQVRASIPDSLSPGDVTEEALVELLESENAPDRPLGIHPELDQPILLRQGPYGSYVQLGDDDQEGKPKRMSLPKGMEPEQVTLSIAIDLLSLPKELGIHPTSGQKILANIGKYGPYVQHGRTFASLTADDYIFDVNLSRALELIATKEAKSKPLRVIGQHPESGEPVEVWEGRYGPYVKHQRLNASLAKTQAPESISMEDALTLLAERAQKKKSRGRKRRTKK